MASGCKGTGAMSQQLERNCTTIHDGDEGTDFNRFEGVNDAAANPSVVEALSKQMREAFGE